MQIYIYIQIYIDIYIYKYIERLRQQEEDFMSRDKDKMAAIQVPGTCGSTRLLRMLS